MKLTLAIPIMNQLHDAKGPLGTFRFNTSDDVEWMIIDNGSTDPVEEFVRRFLKPKRLKYIRNEENIGLVKTMQQAYENCETEILAISHNDVFIYEKDWDKRVLSYFKEIPKLGAASFFGAQGCGPRGERIQDIPMYLPPTTMAGMSNLLEGELHGFILEKEWHPCAIFDGLIMIFSMEMLKKGNGFDQRYYYHHIYDRDASLESIRRGYNNIVVNVPCHHLCGLTANRSEYQSWVDKKVNKQNFTGDKWTHDTNSDLFEQKWKDVLPIYVNDDFSLRKGKYGIWDYKGDAIRKLEF